MEKTVSYKKLWIKLIDVGMSRADLRRAVGMAPNTMTKLRRDELVSMDVLCRICLYLDCGLSDVCDIVKPEPRA